MRPRLVYILASSHSGSTLLAMLLGSHPEICTAGELKATSLGDPDHYRCSCRELIRQCPFWAEVRSAMARRGFDFDVTRAGTDVRSSGSPYVRRLLRPLHRGPLLEKTRDAALWLSPGWRRDLSRIQARNLALVESLLEVTGARMVVDSSKVGIRLKYLLRIPELDVKVVRIIRDGRAVSVTYSRPHELADARDPSMRRGGNGDRWSEAARCIREGARQWRRSNEEAEQIVKCLPRNSWMQVRYEDLCSDIDGVLERLFEFLEVDPRKRVADFRAKSAHVIGNGMRFDQNSQIRLDERWRATVGLHELSEFHAVAGALNFQYGYQ